MSRSYRKQPFQSICGCSSAAHDKTIANRGVRHVQNQALRLYDDDTFLMPHRYECTHNDVWGWNRDGNKHYYKPAQYAHELWFKRMMRK